jgi:hypothetical protein
MVGDKTKVCAVTDPQVLNKLTAAEGVVCARCGAKAHRSANVCDPVPFEPDH